MAKLLDSRYKSSKCEVFSSNGEVNPMIHKLCDSGLTEGNIISYSENSYMFRTKDIFLPYFIEKGLGEGKTIVRVNEPLELMKKNWDKITSEVFQAIVNTETIEFINEQADLPDLIERLYNNYKTDIASSLLRIFKDDWASHIKVYLILYASENKEETFISVRVSPNINWELILEGYKNAILHLNKMFKSNLVDEDLTFCPIDNELSLDLLAIVETVKTFVYELRNNLANEIMARAEAILEKTIDEYEIENQSTFGIERENNLITYYKNTINPKGTMALIRDTADDKDCFVKLNKEYQYLPTSLAIKDNEEYFSEVVPLTIVKAAQMKVIEKDKKKKVTEDEIRGMEQPDEDWMHPDAFVDIEMDQEPEGAGR